MLAKRLIKSNDAGGGACTNTLDLYNPFPDGGGVALYQLNGDATDVSGNYDGAWNGTAAYTTGVFGQAASFNGSSSYINLNHNTHYANVSVSGWFYGNTSTGTLVGKWWDNANRSFLLRGGSGLSLTVGYTDSNVNNEFDFTGTLPLANTWNFFCATFQNSGNITLTINSETQTFIVNKSLRVNTCPWYIGNSDVRIVDLFNGSIDQVRIFNRALRPYEVEALYTEEYCTPTIVPSEHFNTVLYEGTGVSRSITGVGFQPDFTWIKARNVALSNVVHDTLNQPHLLITNSTSALITNGSNTVTFTSDGFDLEGGANHTSVNGNGDDYVAWNFKAGGSAVTNTDGTITSQVSANTEAGFSIVKYNTSSPSFATVGHGLQTTPQLIISKSLDIAQNWSVNTSIIDGSWDYGYLNLVDQFNNSSLTPPTSTVFTTGGTGETTDFVSYCFAEVEGFSNFGTYTGTGTTSGETIITGFEPAFVMTKRVDAGSGWYIADNKRNPVDPRNLLLNINVAETEIAGTGTSYFNFYENGFQVTATTNEINASGGKYIYMAFAADPTTIEPSLEDSFNTVTYTGNGGTQTIGGVFEGGGSFNGSSSKIDLPSLTNSYPFTVSAWINTSYFPSPAFAPIVQQNIAGQRVTIAATSAWNPNQIAIAFGGTSQFSTDANSITSNQWTQITACFRASTDFDFYINGSSANVTNNGGNHGGTAANAIGYNGVSTEWFNGSIDQVRIFNTALTAAQVTELYEETDADSHTLDFPSGAGAVALYELNGNANDTGGTYNGTATNVTWLNNGVGFQPDLVWFKKRSGTQVHNLYDSVRGVSKVLYSNLTNAEATVTSISSFDNNGFTLGNGGADTNASGETYVAWAWKGAELPAINSNGSIPSVVSANPAAGFSIVSFTNTSSTSTIGHGLGVAPDVVIIKTRTTGLDNNWNFYTTVIDGSLDYLRLNTTAAKDNSGLSLPTENVFYYGGDTASTIAYCFAEVAGFSKFGAFNGSDSSVYIDCGFEPAFVMVKNYTGSEWWNMWDNKRVSGAQTARLFANSSVGEGGYENTITFNPLGFTLIGNNFSFNDSGQSYIYMAFANQF